MVRVSDQAREAFEAKVRDIVVLANHHFRGLNPEAREEAIANTLALAWKFWLRLIEQGKTDQLENAIGFAIRQTKSGRSVLDRGGRRCCVMDCAERRLRGVQLERVDVDDFVGVKTPVSDAAAFHVDLPAFLATLSERQRSMAMDLAEGMTTGQTARRYGVTPGAVSQFRGRFKTLLASFHGDCR